MKRVYETDENGEAVRHLVSPFKMAQIKNERLYLLYANLEQDGRQAKQKNVLGALAGLFVLEEKCSEKMRARYREEFKKYDFPSVTVEISDKFNDSIFQENIEVSENI